MIIREQGFKRSKNVTSKNDIIFSLLNLTRVVQIYKRQVLLFLTSMLGSVLSVYATLLTINVREYNVEVQSFCSINALFDCNFVASSEAALLFGIPVAWWAFTYYLWISAVIIWTFISPSNRRPIMVTAFIISTIALAFTIYKACQMIFLLKIICLICILMYFANVVIFLLLIKVSGLKLKPLLGKTEDVSRQTKKESWRSSIYAYLPGLFSIIVVFFIGYSVIKISFPTRASNIMERGVSHNDSIQNRVNISNAVARHFAQAKRFIKLVPDAPVWGNPQAKVTVVEFSDFQCPFCQLAASRLRDILSEFSDHVKLHFIHYPLDKSLNQHITTNGHKYAGLAACAAIYAFDKNKFWEFHDDLFLRQQDLNNETIFLLARSYGWNINQFKKAVQSPDIIDRLMKHIRCGQDVGIEGTPTIYINGRHVEQWDDPDVLRRIIENELQN
jgi:protein-disulfide isomerase/uncharacterized membrane protein